VTGATRVLLATGNAHKVAEIQAILGEGWQVEARDPGVEETGATFEENALIKARALAQATGELAMADDSGIEIDALDGRPGIHSARWTDEGDWVARVLRELADVPESGRGCRYVCAAAAVWPDAHSADEAARSPGAVSGDRGGVSSQGQAGGRTGGPPVEQGRRAPGEVVVRGVVEGVVPEASRGTGGFGYDPVMAPTEGDGRTFAEMSDAEKHALSHRGRAFRLLIPHLATPPGGA
jgi:XTP/dITP diphosphohydrolase